MKRHKVRIDVNKTVTEVTRLVDKYNANEARYSRFCALMEAGMLTACVKDLMFKSREEIDNYFDSLTIITRAENARRIIESRGYRPETDACDDVQGI